MLRDRGPAKDHLTTGDAAPRRRPAAPSLPAASAAHADRRWWRGAWGALALVASVWTVMTWPQVTGLTALIRDAGDPYMKIWQLSWVSHQLVQDPAHLYDANIFFPEAHTLAFSDSMIGPSLLAAPFIWIGVPAVLVFNLLFAAGMILSGVAMFGLVRRLTGFWQGAMFAALAYAFLPYRFDHYSHLELQFTWGIPVALWALHRLFESGALRHGLLLGLAVAIQASCSLYYAAFLGVFLCGIGAVLWGGSPRKARSLRALVAALAVAALCTVPLLLPHLASKASVGERSMDAVRAFSATPASYLAPNPGNRLYQGTLGRFGRDESRLFPGFLLLALAVVGAWPIRWKQAYLVLGAPRLAYLVGTLLAFDTSLGSNGLLYPLLFDVVPLFRAFRVPARCGVLTATGLVVLAGFGLSRLCSHARWAPRSGAVVAVLAAGLMCEYRSFPVEMVRAARTPPPVYTWLGQWPKTVIAEIPVSPLDDFTYMYWSQLHWHPLLNGQSGFFPPWYRPFELAASRFPDPASVAFLRSRGARLVVIHLDRYRGDDRAAMERRLAESVDAVWPVARFPGSGDRVFELR